MSKTPENREVFDQIESFRKKYYLLLLLKGFLLSGGIIFTIYLAVSFLEFSFSFGKTVRFILFITLFGSLVYSFIRFMMNPVLVLMKVRKGISDEEAARMIGSSIPPIKDQLLNILQLMKVSKKSELAFAGAQQKYRNVGSLSFNQAVNWKESKSYLRYFIVPVAVFTFFAVVNPEYFTAPTERIVNFNQEFLPHAPFTFEVDKENYGFRNEDFTISVELNGNSIPNNLYLLLGDRKIKLDHINESNYRYTFKKLQNKKTFRLEAAGFLSNTYVIDVYERPVLSDFNVVLNYPRYTNKKSERLSNIGNLEIPEGTVVEWLIKTVETNSLEAVFYNDSSVVKSTATEDQLFEIKKTFLESESYALKLKNDYSENKESLQYHVNVINDLNPEVTSNVFEDTVFYSRIGVAGNITDDYGFRKLLFHYSISGKNGEFLKKGNIDIPIDRNQQRQAYYYQFLIDSSTLKSGKSVNYYVEVWDNDQVNGSKSTRSKNYTFKIPDTKMLKEEVAKTTEQTENQTKKSLEDAKSLQEKLEDIEKRMKGKKHLTWEDQKLLREILKEKEALEKSLEELREMNKLNNLKKEMFSPQNENLRNKSQQLQQLMEEVLDEETKQLYDELKKLLEEKAGVEQMEDLINEMNKNQRNVEKELDRALELFKRLKVEYELNQIADELKENAVEQEKLGDETIEEETSDKSLMEKQKDLSEKFNEIEENIKNVQKLNQELKKPNTLPNSDKRAERIKNEQKKAEETLEELLKISEIPENEEVKQSEEKGNKDEGENDHTQNNSNNEEKGTKQETDENNTDTQKKRNDAGKSQKKAGEEMKKLSEQMEMAEQGMQMEMMTENIDDLKNIMHNLLKLSFDQEDLFKSFRDVNESDPRFITLSQQQLKLRDDSRIVEDSLISLSKRVFELSSFITREVSEMNENMENSMDALKERKKYKAVSEQQFAMTSMNNLALMLDDVLDKMMNAMSDSMGKGSKNKDSEPSLSELQKQLNERIEKLKESGKSGRELSEELAKLAAEQARLRKQLQQLQERLDNANGQQEKPGNGIPDKMEETELDLVNKKLSEQLIRRQREILTRLLEAENALREKELDDERKGETANYYEKILPNSFNEYLRKKEQEIEMLKTVPMKLYPYYKKEVSEYFKRLGDKELQ